MPFAFGKTRQRWAKQGAQQMAHLRAFHKSNQWYKIESFAQIALLSAFGCTPTIQNGNNEQIIYYFCNQIGNNSFTDNTKSKHINMKKTALLTSAVLLSAAVFFTTGCKKDDTTAPSVTLKGTDMSLVLNAPLPADPGATASDDKDGDITANITSDWATVIKQDLTGTYKVTYKVSDAAGNQGTAVRVVKVINEAAALFEGTYTMAVETDIDNPNGYVYVNYDPKSANYGKKPVICTASTTKNNRVTINRLGDFDNNTVFFDVTGTSIDVPSQTHTNVGSGTASCNVHDRKTDGTGTKTTDGFTLTYNDSKVAPCTGGRTGVVAAFKK